MTQTIEKSSKKQNINDCLLRASCCLLACLILDSQWVFCLCLCGNKDGLVTWETNTIHICTSLGVLLSSCLSRLSCFSCCCGYETCDSCCVLCHDWLHLASCILYLLLVDRPRVFACMVACWHVWYADLLLLLVKTICFFIHCESSFVLFWLFAASIVRIGFSSSSSSSCILLTLRRMRDYRLKG